MAQVSFSQKLTENVNASTQYEDTYRGKVQANQKKLVGIAFQLELPMVLMPFISLLRIS